MIKKKRFKETPDSTLEKPLENFHKSWSIERLHDASREDYKDLFIFEAHQTITMYDRSCRRKETRIC